MCDTNEDFFKDMYVDDDDIEKELMEKYGKDERITSIEDLMKSIDNVDEKSEDTINNKPNEPDKEEITDDHEDKPNEPDKEDIADNVDDKPNEPNKEEMTDDREDKPNELDKEETSDNIDDNSDEEQSDVLIFNSSDESCIESSVNEQEETISESSKYDFADNSLICCESGSFCDQDVHSIAEDCTFYDSSMDSVTFDVSTISEQQEEQTITKDCINVIEQNPNNQFEHKSKTKKTKNKDINKNNKIKSLKPKKTVKYVRSDKMKIVMISSLLLFGSIIIHV